MKKTYTNMPLMIYNGTRIDAKNLKRGNTYGKINYTKRL